MSENGPRRGFSGRTVLSALLMLVVGLAIGLSVAAFLLWRGGNETEPVVEQPAVIVAQATPTIGVVAPPPISIITNTPTITPLPTDMPVPPPTDTPTVTPLPTDTPIPTETPTPSPTPTRVGPLARAIEDAGMFAGPGTIGRINSWIPTGDDVVLLGVSEDRLWYHIISRFGIEGWAAATYFEILRGDVSSLPVSDFVSSAEISTPTPPGTASGSTPTPTGPTQPTGNTSAVAYWNFIEAASVPNGDETWRSEILITVPTGHSYEFQFGDVLQSAAKTIENQEGQDTYSLQISGMACGLPYLNTLIVLQDGLRMVVRNLFTGATGNLFLDYRC
ncbi:MAG: hypothetical protein M9965_21095 [Anaerolineae bacterium]|nr:hypothetical protein [Anaerolineae bacterium]